MTSSRRSAWLRNWVLAVLVAATAAAGTGAMAAGGLGGTQSAQAAISQFCDDKLISAGGRARCSWPGSLLSQVESVANFSGAAHCAVGKENSDGSGGNALDPNCGTGGSVATVCASTGHAGYPYIINNSVNSHTFDGFVGTNGSCMWG